MNGVARPLGVVFDCDDPETLSAFWQGLLGGEVDTPTKTESWVGLGPIEGYGWLGFQKVPEGKSVKNRVHLDLDVDDLSVAVSRARDLGARPIGEVVEEQRERRAEADQALAKIRQALDRIRAA